MAVTRIIERWQGRGATTTEKGVRTLRREWVVTTDSDDTGEPEVIDAVILLYPSAALYAPHPKWAWAVRREMSAEPNGGPRVWLVKASYSNEPFAAQGDAGTSGSPNNPTSPSPITSNQTPADQRPPTVSVTRKEVTKILERDAVTGAAVVNTVGDPFDPPPEVFRSHHILTFRIYRDANNLTWAVRSEFLDTINDRAHNVLGRLYPARSLRCIDYSVDTVWETGTDGLALFFALTVQAEFNPDLWDIDILNTGRRKRIGGSIGDPLNPARLVAIVDGQGQPVADPVPLAAIGVPVEPGGQFHYVTFAGYRPKDWRPILG